MSGTAGEKPPNFRRLERDFNLLGWPDAGDIGEEDVFGQHEFAGGDGKSPAFSIGRDKADAALIKPVDGNRGMDVKAGDRAARRYGRGGQAIRKQQAIPTGNLGAWTIDPEFSLMIDTEAIHITVMAGAEAIAAIRARLTIHHDA